MSSKVKYIIKSQIFVYDAGKREERMTMSSWVCLGLWCLTQWFTPFLIAKTSPLTIITPKDKYIETIIGHRAKSVYTEPRSVIMCCAHMWWWSKSPERALHLKGFIRDACVAYGRRWGECGHNKEQRRGQHNYIRLCALATHYAVGIPFLSIPRLEHWLVLYDRSLCVGCFLFFFSLYIFFASTR